MTAIESYLGRLAEALRGPARIKAGLLAEARAGLDDAAAAYRAAGLPGPEAERRAVGEFGPVPVIAGEFQAELDAAHGRRTTAIALAGMTATLAVWNVIHATQQWPGLPAPAVTVLTLAGHFAELVCVAAMVGALGLRLALGRPGYRLGADSWASRLARRLTITAVAAYGATLAVIVTVTAIASWRLLLSPAIAVALALSLLICGRLAATALSGRGLRRQFLP